MSLSSDVTSSANSQTTQDSDNLDFCRSSRFWFEDGSLILQVGGDAFKVHKTLVLRHSLILSTWISEHAISKLPIALVPSSRGVRAGDLEIFLGYLYHDLPLTIKTPFPTAASVFRVTSPRQMDYPIIHSLAKDCIVRMFPSGPRPFFHPDFLPEALELATEYRIYSIRKGLFYSLVTTSDFITEEHENIITLADSPKPNTIPKKAPFLSPSDTDRCRNLMSELIAHFTPLLFTPAATPHMACTDVMADVWMPCVVQPALDSGGLYQPLEVLERMKEIDWASTGLCAACMREKRDEWTGEQEKIWKRMDGWLSLDRPV